ncbi:30S ribosomal protein S6 [Streptomyces sp. CNQ-509]|jgi:small subunit ribosomal protein S6|uniref:30S ribosomal protein S6 n=1 Tax=Streptomyces TaxID=1883 RepID=UPI000377BE87|nr:MULTISPECIES: 30S ribosomal protein S6 [Streptomyces]AKH83474.1 30S ribosomal protein S6 [Streptomyces sp. CNQ-509]AUH41890.1 30S ribosomal protein S6 [Streptomyces sp. CMB-StM0423]AZM47269.1 30S ribosomal protein S6 [Streptomyces sp. WAC 06738]WBB57924.1 30S ribosomal protein S6 [Streptomyces sp. WMMC500]WSA39032.1 30S ribosomal protein S6 [Streptomyces sp. NBC_01808]
MRHYEVMVILDPDLEERAVSPLIESFLSVIREAKGKVEKVDTWGRRRLAYEIKKKPEGIYSVIDIQAEADVVKELDRQMNLNESVLRTKVLRPAIH